MIAFDGGASALRAVDYVAQHRVFAGLTCVLLSVGTETAEMRRALEEAAAVLRSAGYDVETDMLPGQPEDVIPAQIKDGRADLLIMGAFGHARIRSLFIGSTTTEVIRSCQIPLLLFR